MSELTNLFISPETKQELNLINNELISADKKYKYEIEDDIFKFVSKNNIETKTNSVRDFYLDYSFPNYNDFDTLEMFVKKMSNNLFIKELTQNINPKNKVLEFGCGTGQLGNYLAATGYSQIISADLSINSLKLANNFKKKK